MNNMYSESFHNEDEAHIIKKKLEFYAGRYNVKSVTIADYSAIGLLNDVGLPISLSTNSHNSFAELDMALEIYGADQFESIVVQRDLNRNPQKLNSYLSTRGVMDKAVLMVNEGCINACPFKISGDIEIGLSDIKTKNNVIHGGGCTILQKGHRWTFLTSPFLTKNMVDTYYPGIKSVKIAGRDLPISNIKHQLNHWATGADIELEKILNVFPKETGLKVSDVEDHEDYIKDVMSCNKECFLCRKCETTYGDLTGTVHLKDANLGKQNGFQVVDASKILQAVASFHVD
jgi:collagenase-like PrtC family protease